MLSFCLFQLSLSVFTSLAARLERAAQMTENICPAVQQIPVDVTHLVKTVCLGAVVPYRVFCNGFQQTT